MLLLQPCSASPLSATSQNAPSAVGVQEHSHGTEKKLPKIPPQPRAGKPLARPGWSLEGSSSRKMRCGWQSRKEQPGEEAGDRGHRRVAGKAEPPGGPGRDPLTAPPTAPGGCRTQLQPPKPETRSLSHFKRAAGKNPDPGERAGNLSHLQQPAFLGAGASGQERRAQGSKGLPRGVVAADTRCCQARAVPADAACPQLPPAHCSGAAQTDTTEPTAMCRPAPSRGGEVSACPASPGSSGERKLMGFGCFFLSSS